VATTEPDYGSKHDRHGLDVVFERDEIMPKPWLAVGIPAFRIPAGNGAATAEARPRAGVPDVADEALIAGMCAGERESLACLFQRYALLVRSVASRILRDSSEAEDLVQDLFIFLQRKCAIFDSSKSSARSWIIQMTYHRAIERRRYLTARQFYAREDAEGFCNRPLGRATNESDYSAEAVFGRNGLEKLYESLSEDQRETLRLHFFEGYTLAEVAAKLGQPHGNVRHHYYRGLAKLRKQMFGTAVRAAEPYERSDREAGRGK
jgi:RNA polymerase sigma-70 factor, ECF subfamily